MSMLTWFRGVIAVLLFTTIASQAQWVAFNDHAPGVGTGPLTTTWNVENQPPGRVGPLTNAVAGALPAGAQLPVTLTITIAGNVTFEGAQGNPSPGTPLYNVFNLFVDFTGTPNPSLALNGAGATVTYTFTGLDPSKRYNFKGSSVRAGGVLYTDRWTLFELAGADAFSSTHTANALTTAQVPAILANQCAINTGINDTPTTGDYAGWDNIDPGPDGSFSVNSYQYLGTVPGGSSGGAKGYAMTGLRLEEFNLIPAAASITNQPQSTTVGELQPASFTVGATGNPRPTYQWYKNNSPLTDATNSTYAIAAAPLSDNGSPFKVVVRNVTNGVPNSVT
ncbi:MAG TPA: immunoglobulin domain-containing protein, partial [Patescibacteria group bacterium]|nr:immunoglobulin domain-containing protein [Patescibacteria group bacterium]